MQDIVHRKSLNIGSHFWPLDVTAIMCAWLSQYQDHIGGDRSETSSAFTGICWGFIIGLSRVCPKAARVQHLGQGSSVICQKLTMVLTFAALTLNGFNIQCCSHSELQLQTSTVISNHHHQQLHEHHNMNLMLALPWSACKSSLHTVGNCCKLKTLEQAIWWKEQRSKLTRIRIVTKIGQTAYSRAIWGTSLAVLPPVWTLLGWRSVPVLCCCTRAH